MSGLLQGHSAATSPKQPGLQQRQEVWDSADSGLSMQGYTVPHGSFCETVIQFGAKSQNRNFSKKLNEACMAPNFDELSLKCRPAPRFGIPCRLGLIARPSF